MDKTERGMKFPYHPEEKQLILLNKLADKLMKNPITPEERYLGSMTDGSKIVLLENELKDQNEYIKNLTPITLLVKALKEDKGYYESWKANIAMAFVDQYNSDDCLGIRDTNIKYHSNKAAENFLKQLMS